jgi:putative methionine-R-sulfoxide reductase with GAF domain
MSTAADGVPLGAGVPDRAADPRSADPRSPDPRSADPRIPDPRSSDLERRYRCAADEAAATIRAFHPDRTGEDLSLRMRAVADAIWTHLNQAGVSWVGFYLPHTNDGLAELVLGPSRNKPACSPIGFHGVCGQAFRGRVVRIVHDVRDLGSDYVACDPRDRSEIVLPVFRPAAGGRPATLVGVLDLDSHEVGRFAEIDARGLTLVLESAGFSVSG